MLIQNEPPVLVTPTGIIKIGLMAGAARRFARTARLSAVEALFADGAITGEEKAATDRLLADLAYAPDDLRLGLQDLHEYADDGEQGEPRMGIEALPWSDLTGTETEAAGLSAEAGNSDMRLLREATGIDPASIHGSMDPNVYQRRALHRAHAPYRSAEAMGVVNKLHPRMAEWLLRFLMGHATPERMSQESPVSAKPFGRWLIAAIHELAEHYRRDSRRVFAVPTGAELIRLRPASGARTRRHSAHDPGLVGSGMAAFAGPQAGLEESASRHSPEQRSSEVLALLSIANAVPGRHGSLCDGAPLGT